MVKCGFLQRGIQNLKFVTGTFTSHKMDSIVLNYIFANFPFKTMNILLKT